MTKTNISKYLIITLTLLLIITITIISYSIVQSKKKSLKNSSQLNHQTENFLTINNSEEGEILPTINPQEETNEARDGALWNDSAELLNAFARYYASNNRFPWQDTPKSQREILAEINSSTWVNLLFSSEELKIGFKNKLYNPANRFTVYHNNSNTYVCFNPKSQNKISSAINRCRIDSEISNTTLCQAGQEQVCLPGSSLNDQTTPYYQVK